MKFKNCLLILCLLFAQHILGYSRTRMPILSNQATISLLTCSPGKDLYSLFGHSAIRVRDTIRNIDRVFNYGTFDFQTKNFYLKFARGKLKYMLSVSSFNNFKRGYILDNRSIIEQKLNLDSISRQKLFNALQINALPENRFYSYDFLFDNCSSRIRDVLEDNVDGIINFSQEETSSPKTFWDLLKPYVTKSKWIFLGIRLGLGKPCDAIAAPYQYMFLPDYLMEAFGNAHFKRNNEESQILTQKAEYIYKASPHEEDTTVWYLRPVTLLLLLALALLIYTLRMIQRKHFVFWVDVLLFGIIGFMGWVIVFLWFFTDHQTTGPNFNILWAIPFHFPVAFFLLSSNTAHWIKIYFFINFILLLIIIGGWTLIPQTLPSAILPLLAALSVRSLFIYRYYESKSPSLA